MRRWAIARLVSSGQCLWDKQDVFGISDSHCSIPLCLFGKGFLAQSLTAAEGEANKNWLCFLWPGRFPIPQATPSLPRLSESVHPALPLWHCDHLACWQHLNGYTGCKTLLLPTVMRQWRQGLDPQHPAVAGHLAHRSCVPLFMVTFALVCFVLPSVVAGI